MKSVEEKSRGCKQAGLTYVSAVVNEKEKLLELLSYCFKSGNTAITLLPCTLTYFLFVFTATKVQQI